MSTADNERRLTIGKRGSIRLYWVGLAAILMAGAFVRIYNLGALPFWLDEAHSANFINSSFTRMWGWGRPLDRGNPPGYYTLLKIWAQISRSDVWLRAFSVTAGVLTLVVVYAIARRVADRKGALMATAILAFSGYHTRFSQEARTYALLTLVVAVAIAAVAQIIAQPDGDTADRLRGARPWRLRSEGLGLNRPLTWTDLAWPAYALAGGSAFLLHNTGAFIPVAANIAVVLWLAAEKERPARFIRNWVMANLGIVLIWMLWIPGFLNQLRIVTRDWWVPEATFRRVVDSGADIAAPTFGWNLPWSTQTLWAGVLVAVGFLLIWMGTRRMTFGHAAMIWSFVLTLPIIELAFSQIRPIFLARTLVVVLVPASVAVGTAVTRGRLGWVLGVLVLSISMLGTLSYHLTFDKTPWDEAAGLVAADVGPDTLVFVQPANTVVAFNHYFDEDLADVFGTPSRLPDRVSRGLDVTESDRKVVSQLARDSGDVWLVLNNPDEGESLVPTLDQVLKESQRTSMRDLVLIHYTG